MHKVPYIIICEKIAHARKHNYLLHKTCHSNDIACTEQHTCVTVPNEVTSGCGTVTRVRL